MSNEVKLEERECEQCHKKFTVDINTYNGRTKIYCEKKCKLKHRRRTRTYPEHW